MSETGKVVTTSGASTVAGIAVLPNTGGSTLLTVMSITLIAVSGIVLFSFVATRVAAHMSR